MGQALKTKTVVLNCAVVNCKQCKNNSNRYFKIYKHSKEMQ